MCISIDVKTRVKADYLNCSFLGLQNKAIFGYQHIVHVNAIIDTSHTDTGLIKRRKNTNGELGRKKKSLLEAETRVYLIDTVTVMEVKI